MYSCLGRELSITELFRIQDHCYTVHMPREKHAGKKKTKQQTKPSLDGLLKFWRRKDCC